MTSPYLDKFVKIKILFTRKTGLRQHVFTILLRHSFVSLQALNHTEHVCLSEVGFVPQRTQLVDYWCRYFRWFETETSQSRHETRRSTSDFDEVYDLTISLPGLRGVSSRVQSTNEVNRGQFETKG